MKRTHLTIGIVLACFLLLPLLVGGLLKAGHYQFVSRTLPSWRRQWYIGPTDVMLKYDAPVRGYRLSLNKYDFATYRLQDIPPREYFYRITAQVVYTQGHGIDYLRLLVHDLAGNIVEDSSMRVFISSGSVASQAVGLMGTYDVIAARHGYLPIKKRVVVGPNGAFVKFILPRILNGGRPSHKPSANTQS